MGSQKVLQEKFEGTLIANVVFKRRERIKVGSYWKESIYCVRVLTSIPHAVARVVRNSGMWTRWAPEIISSPEEN